VATTAIAGSSPCLLSGCRVLLCQASPPDAAHCNEWAAPPARSQRQRTSSCPMTSGLDKAWRRSVTLPSSGVRIGLSAARLRASGPESGRIPCMECF
jgi:hypothetical protein